MAYVAMLPLLLHPPRFDCKDDPSERDSERVEGDASYDLASRGLPLPRDRFPKQATLVSSHPSVNDILYAVSMKWAVSSRVRDILEAYASGQVEFIPVELTRKGKKPVNDFQYFYINILNGLKTIQWDKVNFTFRLRPDCGRTVDTIALNTIEGRDLGLRVDRVGYEDIRVWYERDAGGISQWMFMSDDIAEAMAQAAITGPLFAHVQE